MPYISVKELRDAASAAHERGDGDAAIRLFQRIVDLFPETTEAVDAVFYLSSIGKIPRRPEEKKKTPPEGGLKVEYPRTAQI